MSWLVAAQYPGLVKRLVILAAPHFGLAQYNMWRLRVSSLVQVCCFWYILLFQARTLFRHGYSLHIGMTFRKKSTGSLSKACFLLASTHPSGLLTPCSYPPCDDIMLA